MPRLRLDIPLWLKPGTFARRVRFPTLRRALDVDVAIVGGGITGAIAALRSTGRAGSLVVVGYELMDSTRPALLDGTLTFIISHPLARIAQEALAGMVRAVSAPNEGGNFTTILPFEVYTRENI